MGDENRNGIVNVNRGENADVNDTAAQNDLLRAQLAQFEESLREAQEREQTLRARFERVLQLDRDGQEDNEARDREPRNAGINNPGIPMAPLRVDNYRVPKLPPFMKSNPQVWFGQVEASFRTARITSQRTMADTIISFLEPATAELISDIIVEPDPIVPYTRLKERLLALYGESPEARLRRLLRGQIDARGKPSHIFAQIRAHTGVCSDTILRSIFLEHMPEQLRGLLVAANKDSLQDLAQYADLLADAMNCSPTQTCEVKKVDATAKTPSARDKTPTRDSLSEINRGIREILKLLADRDQGSVRSRSPARKHEQNKNASRSRSRSREPSDLCRFHRKFAEKAYFCVQPCSWQGPPPIGKPEN